ncbi:Flp pilus assembly protein CpaB [Aurantimonas sp. MSK8Z-1]|uniref:Flp pilus assembly protein CpaB n=1 Tax=Mangrovibrevibacter kandeliae TaxID=2968473 RepID=UPI0021188803|nr:Flp pilus assembly protein CpaB [Aurantimonas sp. MSK8Z-1]MCW4116821.1 Flp pilus assembly protein CpaB [Aurantimonas sp. MSK8Z-1]
MMRLVFLIVALSAAGLAIWFTLSPSPAPQPETVVVTEPAPPPPMADVLVASGALAAGTALGTANLQWKAWPADSVPAGFITRTGKPEAMAELTGSIVRSQFQDGEPIREDKLAPVGSGFMSAILPAGMRATAVRISAENTAGGFVLPNDRVDVVLTETRGDVATSGPVSRTVLSNVKVLAVDQTQHFDPANPEKVVLGKTATLELDPRQVEVVTAAEAAGNLSLSLRSLADGSGPTGAPRTVRVHRNGAVETVTVGRHGTPAAP